MGGSGAELAPVVHHRRVAVTAGADLPCRPPRLPAPQPAVERIGEDLFGIRSNGDHPLAERPTLPVLSQAATRWRHVAPSIGPPPVWDRPVPEVRLSTPSRHPDDVTEDRLRRWRQRRQRHADQRRHSPRIPVSLHQAHPAAHPRHELPLGAPSQGVFAPHSAAVDAKVARGRPVDGRHRALSRSAGATGGARTQSRGRRTADTAGEPVLMATAEPVARILV